MQEANVVITNCNVALPARPSWSIRLQHYVLVAYQIHRIRRVRTIDPSLQNKTAEPPKHPSLPRTCLLHPRKGSARRRDLLPDGLLQEKNDTTSLEHRRRGLAAKAQAVDDPRVSVPALLSSDVRHRENTITAVEIPPKVQAIQLKRRESMNTGSDHRPVEALIRKTF